jgi:hypothetical protein
MSNQNDNNKPEGSEKHEDPKHHESWVKHVIDEIKEEIAELKEEAQNLNPDEFPVLGNGHINVVHDHHHDHDKKEEGKDEK